MWHFGNLKSETGLMEVSDQGNRIGREKLFVCQLFSVRSTSLTYPMPEWPLNPMEGEVAGAHGKGEWDYV